jgi:ABC-type multidrug transport system ATPase subunit
MWSLLAAERRERGATILFSTHYLDEAEPSDRVVMLARGKVVADGSPGTLRDALGRQVAEIEGPGASRLVEALRARGLVQLAHRTERGWRVGLRGSREEFTELAGAAPDVTRLSIRPPMLEDVYFARTQGDTGDGRG